MNIFRKSVFITLVLTCILAFVACNNDKKSEEDDASVISPIDDTDKDNGDTSKPTEEPSKKPEELNTDEDEDTSEVEEKYNPDFIHNGEPLGYTQHNFYYADLFVKAPAYHEVNHGLKNFHYASKITLGYYDGTEWDIKDYEIETIEDIMDNMLMVFVNGTSRYVYGDFESIEFESIEEMTINDIEMIRYEGEMTVKDFKDANKRHVVAYTFLYNDLPNAIFAVAGDIDQSQQDIDELIHNIDESVKTIVPKNP